MAEKIKVAWNMGVEIKGGPRNSLSDDITVDAYDMIDVTITKGAIDKEVQIHPAGAEQVLLLMISSDRYGELLKYKVAGTNTDFELDAPHLLIGKGAVAMLGAVPETLLFTNGLSDPAEVQILVGRKATP